MPDIRNMRKDSFAWVENEIAQNPNLSLRGLGLYTLMVSYPNDWVYHLSHLAEQKTDSLYATRQAFNELVEAGLVVRQQKRDDDNQFAGYEYQVVGVAGLESVSQIPVCRNPVHGDSVDGQTHTTNKQDTKKDFTKKQYKEKQQTSSRVSKNDIQKLLDTYNKNRGQMSGAKAITPDRHKGLKKLIQEHGFDTASDLLEKATKERVADGWYVERGYGLDELLRQSRVVQYAERYEQQPKQPKVITADVRMQANRAAMDEWLERTNAGEDIEYETLVQAHLERLTE